MGIAAGQERRGRIAIVGLSVPLARQQLQRPKQDLAKLPDGTTRIHGRPRSAGGAFVIIG